MQPGYEQANYVEIMGADDDEVDIGPPADLEDQPGERGDNGNDAVAILQLRLQVAREEGLANEQLRRAEKGRVADART